VRRVQNNLTQQQLAERTRGALSKSHISMIESGTIADPGVTKVIALARALECSVGELLDETHEAEDLLNKAGLDDEVERRQGLLLLQYWDELSEERRPTALGIMEMLASESSGGKTTSGGGRDSHD
jgi:transcriptional regulator with XRE-family HTH domain